MPIVRRYYPLSVDEASRLVRNERNRRRTQRLNDVRERSRQFAADKREEIRCETLRQRSLAGSKIRAEMKQDAAVKQEVLGEWFRSVSRSP